MKKTILIVEDYKDVREMMKFLVCGYGYEVVEAENGLEAVEKAKHYHPDLILMDMAMPIMDGLRATQIIRKSEANRKIPIIAVTAFDKDFYHKAIEAGCDEVIAKPVDFNTFETFLNRYFEH